MVAVLLCAVHTSTPLKKRPQHTEILEVSIYLRAADCGGLISLFALKLVSRDEDCIFEKKKRTLQRNDTCLCVCVLSELFDTGVYSGVNWGGGFGHGV